MEIIPKSGKFYPNKFARIAIQALEDVMGRNGVNAILNLANLSDLINNLPPDNLERKFDFADFSAINGALEVLYGVRGGRGLAQRAGRTTFDTGLKNFGALAGVTDKAFQEQPLEVKLRIGMPAVARIFSQTSDQRITVTETDDHFIFSVQTCPVCWGRHADTPDCAISIGLLQAGLKWVSGGLEFNVSESRCIAVGDEACDFIILKQPVN
jgi:predicted hydrocarbon binding protein